MRSFAFLAIASAVSAQQIQCPTLPKEATQSEMAKGVPIVPGDIPTGCSALEVLVARGTGESNFKEGNGKFGIVVGDPLIGNLTKALPGARGYPVQYPASSNIAGISSGADDVAKRIAAQSAACPDQKFALVGYSQGAVVMRAAASKRISKDLYPKIVALAMYGDPGFKGNAAAVGGEFPDALKSKLIQNCAPGDSVCDSCGCFFHHLQYIRQTWVDKNVDYIVSAFKGTPKPAKSTGIGVDNSGKLGEFCQQEIAAGKGAKSS